MGMHAVDLLVSVHTVLAYTVSLVAQHTQQAEGRKMTVMQFSVHIKWGSVSLHKSVLLLKCVS